VELKEVCVQKSLEHTEITTRKGKVVGQFRIHQCGDFKFRCFSVSL